MNKKKINTDEITNELQHSAFFPNTHSPASPGSIKKVEILVEKPLVHSVGENKKQTDLAIKNDIMTSRSQDSIVEKIRKIVKVIGKETTPLRMTPSEKEQLSDIVYAFKKKGIRTSENEINRIASSLLLLDYKQNRDESVLAKVLTALNG